MLLPCGLLHAWVYSLSWQPLFFLLLLFSFHCPMHLSMGWLHYAATPLVGDCDTTFIISLCGMRITFVTLSMNSLSLVLLVPPASDRDYSYSPHIPCCGLFQACLSEFVPPPHQSLQSDPLLPQACPFESFSGPTHCLHNVNIAFPVIEFCHNYW